MRFKFQKQSKLFGRKVSLPIQRVSYVARSREVGVREYIFAYRNRIPDEKEEPDLYRGARVSREKDAVNLIYNGLCEMVVLITTKADDKFRRERPEVVDGNEVFIIEE